MEDQANLRPKDVAHILDCCPDDLYPLIYAGEIMATKVGRMWRFRLEDVLAYKDRLNGRSVGAEEPGKANSA